MILYIDTTGKDSIEVALGDGDRIFKKRAAAFRKQSEKLLPLIGKILRERNLGLEELEKIMVKDQGGSFTSLRIGVATANALGFALRIPVEAASGRMARRAAGLSVVEPAYDKGPNITLKKT